MKLVIAGGGFAGIKLALLLANDPKFKITLISSSANFEYNAALYRSATGHSPMEVVIPLSKIFKNADNVDFVLDTVENIDVNNRMVVSRTGNHYSYDKLVVAVGQVANYFGIKGMKENSFSMDTISRTIELRQHLHAMITRDDVDSLNFVIVGAGASGMELAAELPKYLERMCEKHTVPDKNIHVRLIEGSGRVLPRLSPLASRMALKRLNKLGVNVELNTMVTGRSAGSLELTNLKIDTHTVVWTAGFQANPLLQNINEFELEKNRVKVNEYLEGARNVYVIGDNALTPYSGMAQTALHHAEYVANNLRSQMVGRNPKQYTPRKPIYVVPAGNDYAILQWGKMVLWGKAAWMLRRIADFRLFNEFEPFRDAVMSWRAGNRSARVTCPLCKTPQDY